ncbi:uncharacterized protein PV09_06605 [Verruconis gallopava]|uniref:Alpha-1,2-mannosyltransferase n=1 Tax=Verruconis gallopava TaxID=253628 RepID=A0A0D2ASG9_9PEZI|nr:uncharacterized protein PV09_06605 [Verruconis gallopava]KIW02114.1 hypothetical protein PV09_06605 [Verruconis gallopava]
MERSHLILLGSAFAVSSALILLLSKKRREIVFRRLPIRRRVSSSAATPPRSLSPEKKPVTESDYSDVYPPSRRFTLRTVAPHIAEKSPKPDGGIFSGTDEKKPLQAPLDVPFADWDPKTYTPTEFSKEEIEALGDFPDYATLSGVPLPEPYKEFVIEKSQPRPYRPFRWAYHQTMSLTKMEPDWWLELESTYVERIKQRQELFRKHGKSVLDSLPGSEHACKELMEMCIQFLCARYPQYFSFDKESMVLDNKILGTKTNVKSMPPLEVLLNNVPEDFAIMLRDPKTGFYSFRAGMICSSLGWNLGTKMGMRLHEIHEPIPDYKEKMQFSMDRYFTKKPTDKSIQRGSWGLEVDQPLYMPPGDPHELHRDSQNPNLKLEQCHLRVDWQTLRRLPLSAGVVFNFKALFTPVTEFRDEPYIPALVLKVLNEGKENLMKYKNTWHVEHVVKPALAQWAKEQEEKGVVQKDWKVQTLDESPFFPGWEEKWRRQQGF